MLLPPTCASKLQAASEDGHLEIVERLLTAGANVNADPAENGGRTGKLVDGALKEPGRVNGEAEFRLADKEMIARLFRFAYQEHEAAGPLAEEFATKIPKREFSPAEVLSFLASNFRSPEGAVSGAEGWMATLRYERKKMGRQSGKDSL